MWLEFLILSPFLWIPALIIFAAFGAWLVESELAAGLTIAVVVVFVLLQTLTSLDPFGFIVAHPLWTLVGLVGYFAIGMLWARFKWRWFVGDKMHLLGEKTEEARKYYATELADPTRRDAARKKVRDMASNDTFGRSGVELPLQVSKSKARIMGWMAYWPFSAFHFLLWDSLKRAYEWAYRTVATSFQRFSDSAYAEHKAKFSED